MAAPTSKQSPSNQKMHETPDENRLKDPPPSSSSSAPPTASTDTTSASTSPPSYKKSETSESYRVAKQLLNADNFEEALTVIEDELIKTTDKIKKGLGLDPSSTNVELETEIQFHEALAPLHYLYGTTLLYSLEVAKDDGNDTGAMMTEAGTQAATTTTAPQAAAAAAASDPSNPWGHLPADGTPAPEAAANGEDASAEDIQIAWENLEAARAIVEKMLLQATVTNDTNNNNSSSTSNLSEAEVAKLQLDLAQIHLREGDLQRSNGNYTSAVGDYSSCLEILMRHNQTKDEQNNLRDLNRKIADTQFNLGLTYLTNSSDLQREVANANANNTNANANADANQSDGNTPNNAELREKATVMARDHCQKGIQQYVDCSRTLCGILAKLCGVEPETILLASNKSVNTPNKDETPKKPVAGFKTTGLDDDDSNSKAASAADDASQTLNVWRKAASTMVVAHTLSNPEDALRVSDILQLLDEIQETIDEAERSQEGVLQAAEIKVKAQQAAAALGGDESGAVVAEVTNADGSTTTIGFGASSSIEVTAADSKSSASEAAAAKPMMVVKKKKKKRDHNNEGEESDANKKAKTA